MTPPETEDLAKETASSPVSGVVTAYRRSNGAIGIRNNVLVLPSVICSHIVADRIAEETDGAVSVPHDHGCAQIGADHDQTERTLLHLAQNPNVAGTTVVGLGCEHLQSGPFAERIAQSGVPIRETSIQDAGGTDACLDEGIAAVTELAEEAKHHQRSEAKLRDITVGIVSSDLSDSTRAVANPLIGTVVDRLLEAGSSVLVAGTERLRPHEKSVRARAQTDELGEELRHSIVNSAGHPGNSRGLVDEAATHSFDSVVGHWGSAPVTEFISYGEQPSTEEGLVLVDGPSRFEEAATALAAGGSSLIIHVTAEGVPTGHPVVPVFKVTGERSTAEALSPDIDCNARSSTADDVLAELLQVAAGEPTAAERHGLTKFAINRVGPSM